MPQQPVHSAPFLRRSFGHLWNAPYLLLILAVLFWSGNFIIGRATAGLVPPIALAFWRWIVALILVFILGGHHIRRDWNVLKSHWKILFVLGATGIAAFNTLVYLALQQTTAINALLLQSTMPVLIIGAAFLMFGERSTMLQVAGVLVSIFGVATIAARGDLRALSASSLNIGDLWVMVAVISYAFYSVLLRKRPAVHPLSFLAAIFAVGAVLLLPLYIHEHVYVAQLAPRIETWLAIAYCGVFPSLLSYLLFNRGVELVGASRAGLFVHLLPVFGSALAILLLGEQLQAYHLIGAGFIALGLVLATLRR